MWIVESVRHILWLSYAKLAKLFSSLSLLPSIAFHPLRGYPGSWFSVWHINLIRQERICIFKKIFAVSIYEAARHTCLFVFSKILFLPNIFLSKIYFRESLFSGKIYYREKNNWILFSANIYFIGRWTDLVSIASPHSLARPYQDWFIASFLYFIFSQCLFSAKTCFRTMFFFVKKIVVKNNFWLNFIFGQNLFCRDMNIMVSHFYQNVTKLAGQKICGYLWYFHGKSEFSEFSHAI